MPTSSTRAIGRLLGAAGIKAIAARVGVRAPISLSEVRRRASFEFLANWELVTPAGILKDSMQDMWHTGHLTDVYPVDANRLLVSSASGGAWLVARDESFQPTALSDDWPTVDLRCLGPGPRPGKHFYAAGDEGALFETETRSLRSVARFLGSGSTRSIASKLGLDPRQPLSVAAILSTSDAPLFDWRPIDVTAASGGPGTGVPINRLAVADTVTPPKLVLATDRGVYWADVPAAGQDYGFAPAADLPQRICWGVAALPGGTVVATPAGDPHKATTNGVYTGTWQGGVLRMARSTHLGDIDLVEWNQAVLAACAQHPETLYVVVSGSGAGNGSLKRAFRRANLSSPPLSVKALAAVTATANKTQLTAPIQLSGLVAPSAQDAVYAVLRSDDGGATWSPPGPNRRVLESLEFPRYPGFFQYATLALAVSHTDPNLVAVGTRTGPLIGRQTGGVLTWEDHGDPGSDNAKPEALSGHLHADVHGLRFDPNDPTGSTLYICTDGGLTYTTDLGKSGFISGLNHLLPTLEFQGYPKHVYAAPYSSSYDGASGASVETAGLLAGALQDNGVVFSFRLGGETTSWQQVPAGGDGIVAVLLKSDQLLFWDNDDPNARVAKWQGTGFGASTNVDVRAAGGGVAQGSVLASPFAEPVIRPVYRQTTSKQLLTAVAAYPTSGPSMPVWGLFADDGGDNPAWDYLGTVPAEATDSVTAIASDTGASVLIGTASGKIFQLDTPTGSVTAMEFDDPSTAPKDKVCQFAFAGQTSFARYPSALLRADPTSHWASVGANGLPTNEGAYQFLAADTEAQRANLYLATDWGVHATWDDGANWLPVSQGLPRRSHPSTLRFVHLTAGTPTLYLFTFGRSVYRADLDSTGPGARLRPHGPRRDDGTRQG